MDLLSRSGEVLQGLRAGSQRLEVLISTGRCGK
jgi:hypothetical protein